MLPWGSSTSKPACLVGAVRVEEGVDFLRADRQIEPVENRMAIHPKGEIANVE
jgi:hypothetical protein